MKLNIAWLYPDLMSTYGDRGNVIVLKKRCQWRGIDVEVKRISVQSKLDELQNIDFIFMGGAQDTQQEIVNKDLFSGKGEEIKKLINNNIPALFICGAYQFMGKYYLTAESKKLEGLGLFDLFTESSKVGEKRLIGNVMIKPICYCEEPNHNGTTKQSQSDCFSFDFAQLRNDKFEFVGFENHGGRTYLGDKSQAFASVIKGYGNNGEDRTEGIRYKNAIGTYLHGPILPKNPEIADWLIEKALEIKYKKKIELSKLDDSLEYKARSNMISRI